jgi:Asp-tRNA(Asn)/Glu-tRNA(Gln) amidotransferase A subunit family amidase
MADAWEPIADIARKVETGELKAVDLVEKSLAAIAEHEDYKAIIATTADRARERAREIDAVVADGKKVGRLAGVPFIAKDNFLVFGAATF